MIKLSFSCGLIIITDFNDKYLLHVDFILNQFKSECPFLLNSNRLHKFSRNGQYLNQLVMLSIVYLK